MKKFIIFIILGFLLSHLLLRSETFMKPDYPLTLNVDTFTNIALKEYVLDKLKPALIAENKDTYIKPTIFLNFDNDIASESDKESVEIKAMLHVKYPYFLFSEYSDNCGQILDPDVNIYVLSQPTTQAVNHSGKN